MSQVVLICPHCQKRLGINARPSAGTLLTCPTCKKQFITPQDGTAPSQPAPPRMAPPKSAKPPKIDQPLTPAPQLEFSLQPSEFAPFQQPANVPPPAYPQYYSQSYTSSAPTDNSKFLIIGLSAAGGVIALLLVIGVIVIFALNSGTPAGQIAAGPAGIVSSPQAPRVSSSPITPSPSTTSGTPFASAPRSDAVRQLPIVGADAALAYRWEPDKNYDYDFELNATLNNTRTSFTGNTKYKFNPKSSEQLARLAGGEGAQEGSGTAFVVHSDGLLVTCAHVVRGSSKVNVTIGERSYPGDVVGVDDRHDLALIRVAASNLAAVPLANSDQVQLAEEVRAVGFPLSDVLGTSVKITRGSIAGVVTKNGDRLLQIDASINPGNSGGPLFNDRGEVVGINSAGLVGEAITNIGFAVPANYALALLQSKGIKPSSTSNEKQLTGPELARAVTPAVAFVKVDLGISESLQFLEYNGFIIKSGTTFQLDLSMSNHETDQGNLLISPAGEVVQSSSKVQLPLLFMPLSSLAIEKLPSGGERAWESRRVTALTLPMPSTEAESFSPFGPGGMGRERYPRSRLRPQEQELLIIPAVEEIKYKIMSETAEALEIEKTHDISSVNQDGGEPTFRIAGRGKITWDKKHGAPRLIRQTMTTSISAGPAQVSVPMDLKVELRGVTTDAERAESLRRRPGSTTSGSSTTSSPSTISPLFVAPKFSVKTLDDHIAALKSKNPTLLEVSPPLAELCTMEPVPARREEVASVLDPLLLAKDQAIRYGAFSAIHKWGTQKNVPTLIKVLGWKTPIDRRAAMIALGNIGGSKEAAEAVAKGMLDKNDRPTAKTALQKMGSIAEDAVWQHIGSSDTLLHSNACQVLTSIGTQKSVARLQELLKKKTAVDPTTIEITLQDIQKRLAKERQG